jgi:hypothetical protein
MRLIEARFRFRRQMAEMTLAYYRNALQIGVEAMRGAAGAKPAPADGKPATEKPWSFSWNRSQPENGEAPRRPQPAEPPPRLLLEGATGDVVVAAFGVENSMTEPCLATFRLAPGSDLAPFEGFVSFLPAQVSLQPAEQAVVQVSATIAASMVANSSYTGEIDVDGLPASGIPIVIRRRALEDASPAA